MQGALIYAKKEIDRNQRFVELFYQAAEMQNVALQVIAQEDISFGYYGNTPFFYVDGKKVALDFAIMRVMNLPLSIHLENMGISLFNPASVSEVCNDKKKTAIHFAKRGLPMVPTAFVSSAMPMHPFSYPIVLKSSHGCGGREVYLCENEEQYIQKLAKLHPSDAVAQPFIHTKGEDVRIYMLGGEVYQAMRRYSKNEEEFRSNFGIHGLATVTLATEKMVSLAKKAIEGLNTMLVGVDFFVDLQGELYINEIEDAVGTRMLYQFTNKQIVQDYMQLIKKTVKQKECNQ